MTVLPQPRSAPPLLEDYWRREFTRWEDAAHRLKIATALLSHETGPVREDPLKDFDAYISRAGVRYFTAKEITRVHNVSVGGKLAYQILLPNREAWLGAAVLYTLADQLRDAAGGPVRSRNWWRPPDYNREVGGAKFSDHIWACAIDLDFDGMLARRKAQHQVLEPLWESGGWCMSIGVGRRTLHIGLFAPRTLEYGQRRWKYSNDV